MEIQATFRQIEPTEELERQIFEGARDLDRLTGGELTHCHVILEGSKKGHRSSPVRARVAVLGSRGALGVTHDVRVRASHSEPRHAVADAFEQVRRQLRSELVRRAATRRAAEGRPRLATGDWAVPSWA